MTTRMLIDARHPEETRVAVVKGNTLTEFDFEAADRRQLKGNIYLAKVTRVEPSLQAAFIDYGGNRHGFLAFSEIHPDYYQIPREDRERLLREEAELTRNGDDDHAHEGSGDEDGDDEAVPRPEEHGGRDDEGSDHLRRKRMALRRRYKIQDVIKRRQVMLVQVVKEERGNKGAALTTYLSLAGRYCVLMPNTAHGGGISRKISNTGDRKRLKSIIAGLGLPTGMGAIVRTAGVTRSETEIVRDFDYLTRLWDEIRETTLKATAPSLIHQDSDLIKRAIRDIYSREIDQVLVDGDAGFTQAREFMTLLMPTHAPKVQAYTDATPLFQAAGIEGQLAQLTNPVVQLKSGGYMVISPTEALVAIDINSGRSTREYNIEETAYKTNLEAADEIARQIRLRDMAGLIVIDFIDMESGGNDKRVERLLKEALRHDRARIQVGRISAFGLLEMSRQRLRTGLLEATSHSCPMCDGTGLVRSVPSAALTAMRLVEEEAARGRASRFRLRADHEVSYYINNRKRAEVAELEARYGVSIEVVGADELVGGRFAVDTDGEAPARGAQVPKLPAPVAIADEESFGEEPDGEVIEREDRPERDGDRERGRGRGRRRRSGSRRDEPGARVEADAVVDEGRGETESTAEVEAAALLPEDGPTEAERGEGEGEPRRRRRRSRRRRGGGRGEGADSVEAGEGTSPGQDDDDDVGDVVEPVIPALADSPVTAVVEEATAEVAPDPATDAEPAPKIRKPRGRRAAPAPEPVVEPEAEAAPKRRRAPAKRKAEAEASDAPVATLEVEPEAPVVSAPEPVAAEPAPVTDEPARPARRGWWQRTFEK